MMSNRTSKILGILLVLCALALPLGWLKQGELLIGTDIAVPLSSANYHKVTSVWDPGDGIGKSYGGGLYVPRWALWGIPSLAMRAGISPTKAEALTFGILLASWVVALWFLLRGIKIAPAGVIAGLSVGLFNPYIVERAHDFEVLPTLILSALWLGALLRIRAGRSPTTMALVAALPTVLVPIVNPSTRLAGVALVLIVGIYLWFKSDGRIRRALARFALLAIGITTILNLPFWYAYGVFLGDNAGYASAGAQEWLHGVSASASWWNVVRLIGAWDWFQTFSGEPYISIARFYQSTGGILLSLIPLGLIAYALVFKRRWTLWHGIALAGIILAAGTHPPLGFAYQWLYDHVPGFEIFRSPWYKFSMWIVIAYAALVGLGTTTLLERLKSRALRLVALFLLAGALIANGWPLLTGARYPRPADRQNLAAMRVQIPDYAHESAAWIKEHSRGGRVLLLPQHRFDSTQLTWGYGNLVPIQNLLFDPVGVIYRNFLGQNSENAFLDQFEAALRRGDEQALNPIAPLGVDFVLTQRDFAYRAFNLEDQSAFYQTALGKLQGLKRAKTFGQWDIWQVETAPVKAFTAPWALELPTAGSLPELLQNHPDAAFLTQPHSAQLRSTAQLYGKWGLGDGELRDGKLLVRLSDIPGGSFRFPYTITSYGSANKLFVDGVALKSGASIFLDETATIELDLAAKPVELLNGGMTSENGWTVVDPSRNATFSPGTTDTAFSISGKDAYLYQTLSPFDAERGYLVGVRYKTEGTARWQAAIEQPGPAPFAADLPSSSDITTITRYLKPQPGLNQGQLEIRGSGTGTIHLEEITLKSVEGATAFSLFPQEAGKPEAVQIEAHGSSAYVIRGTASRDGILVFNEGYAPGWRAYEGGQELYHFKAQGYANGWRLNHGGAFELEVRYQPQQTFRRLFALMIGLTVMLLLLALARRLYRPPPKKAVTEPRWILPLAFVIIGALSLVPLLWFRGHGLITGADVNFPMDPIGRFLARLSAWDLTSNGGRDQSALFGSLVFHGYQALWQKLGFGLTAVERLELVSWNALLGFSFFALMRAFLGRRAILPALVTTIFWLFNPYRIVMWTETNVATLAGSVALPLWLLIGLKVGRGHWKPFWGGVAAGGILVLGSGMGLNPPILVLFAFAALLFFVGGALRYTLQHKKEHLKRWLHFGAWALIWSLVFNAYWIIPFAGSLLQEARGAGNNLAGFNLLSWAEGLSRDTSWWNVARLQGAWDWYQNYKAEPYITFAHFYRERLDLILVSLLPIVGLVGGAWALRRRRGWLGFILVLVGVGIVFGMGVHVPMRGIFSWASEHIPGFWMFRSPWYKFTFWTVLGYALALGAGLVYLQERLRSMLGRGILAAVVGSGIILSSFPLLTGQLFPNAKERTELNNYHVQVPAYIFEATQWLNAQPPDGKLMYLPKETAYNYTWGYGGAGDVGFDLIKRPIITPLSFSEKDEGFSASRLIDLAYQYLYASRPQETLAILKTLNVRYLLHKKDSRYDFYQNPDSPSFVQQHLAAFPKIKLVKNFGEWDIYQVDIPIAPAGVLVASALTAIKGNPTDYAAALEYAGRDGARGMYFANQNEPIEQNILDQSSSVVQFFDPNAIIEINDGIQFPLEAVKDDTYEIIINGRFRQAFSVTIENTTLTSEAAKPLGDNWYSLGNVTLNKGTHTTTVRGIKPSPNLIANPNFSAYSRGVFSSYEQKDCDVDAPGRPDFELRSQPGPDGGSAATLTARSHVLCVAQKITERFVPGGIYKLSFDARANEGEAPSYAVWQVGPQAPLPSATLPKKDGWQHVDVLFRPEVSTTALELFWYADGRRASTSASYANVRLVRLMDDLTFTSLAQKTESRPNVPPPPAMRVIAQSPTAVTVEVKAAAANSIVALLTGYDPGWKATVVANGKRQAIPARNHFAHAGYANGWIVPQAGEYTVELRYQSQTLFVVSLVIGLGGLLLVLGLAALARAGGLERRRATSRK